MRNPLMMLMLIASLTSVGDAVAATVSVAAGQSVQAAINGLSAGDTLEIRGGTYDEWIGGWNGPAIPGGSSWSSPVTIKAAPGETVWLKGASIRNAYTVLEGLHLSPNYTESNTLTIHANHVRIENTEITGASHEGGITSDDNLDDLQLINLDIHHVGIKPDGTVTCLAFGEGEGRGFCHGTYFNHCTNVVFRGGQIHHNEGMGIHNGNPGQIVDGVAIHNNGTHGIIFRYGPPGNIVRNSLFYNNKDSGIWGGGRDYQFLNNTFVGNTMGILSGTDGPNFSVINNIFFNTGMPIDGVEPATRSGNLCYGSADPVVCQLNGDPGFVNAAAGDFHVESGSPAVDAGTLMAEVTTDRDNVPRPQGAGMDIGAYEVGGGTRPPPVAGKLPPPTNFRIGRK
jgi:hypothetical protein